MRWILAGVCGVSALMRSTGGMRRVSRNGLSTDRGLYIAWAVAHGHTQGQWGLGHWHREVGKVGSDPCHNLLTSARSGCLPGNQRSPEGTCGLGVSAGRG